MMVRGQAQYEGRERSSLPRLELILGAVAGEPFSKGVVNPPVIT